jgi:serine/threonine protein kinase
MDGPITRHGGNPTEKDALYDLVRYGGLPPQSWLEFWNIDDHCKEKLQGSSWFKPFEGSLEGEYERSWQGLAARLSASSNENSEGLGESTAELIDMLQKMMVVDPDKRITMSEVLKHPFWAAGQTAAELVADV